MHLSSSLVSVYHSFFFFFSTVLSVQKVSMAKNKTNVKGLLRQNILTQAKASSCSFTLQSLLHNTHTHTSEFSL